MCLLLVPPSELFKNIRYLGKEAEVLDGLRMHHYFPTHYETVLGTDYSILLIIRFLSPPETFSHEG